MIWLYVIVVCLKVESGAGDCGQFIVSEHKTKEQCENEIKNKKWVHAKPIGKDMCIEEKK